MLEPKRPKLPRAFKFRGPERIMDHFRRLTDDEKREFIKTHLGKNLFAESVAEKISRIHSGAYDFDLRTAGLDYQVREQKLLEMAKKLKPTEKIIFDGATLTWFASCNAEQKLRMLKKQLYGADPLLFIHEIVRTYKETNNAAYLDLFVGLGNTKILREMQKLGYGDLLKAVGFKI